MIKSRIIKIEKSIPVNNRPFRDISDTQLVNLALRLRLAIHKRIKNEGVAREYKELFIDSPTMFEMLSQTDKTHKEMLDLLERQRNWEIEHEKSQEQKDKIAEQYEKHVKAYKFFKKIKKI